MLEQPTNPATPLANVPVVTPASVLPSTRGATKASRLRHLIQRPELALLMEAHNGLSAKIAQEAGFEALWASGLAISASLGVRDSNEASWTQVLELLEFMSDATTVPILVDGDTGYGNFNNMRRLVQKLEQRNIAGVCIEDKLFPKTNSFLRGETQPLAEIDEFCGRIKAGKDAQQCDDFVIVARVEAFIAGWGLDEAMKRAEAYHQAGADAILMHSAKRSAEEIIAFKQEWGDRSPVVIVPTKYYWTPVETYRDLGIAAVIWANHLMRGCIATMQQTAREIHDNESLVDVEERIAPLAEVFRLQGADELAEAEKRYLPQTVAATRAIILGAAHGPEFGTLTDDKPKCMVEVAGKPVLHHIIDSFRAIGVRDIHVIRGYKGDAVNPEGVNTVDCDASQDISDTSALYEAAESLDRHCVISYGDVLFKKYIPQQLLDLDADFAVPVDTNWRESRNRGRYTDFVTCSEDASKRSFYRKVSLQNVSNELVPGEIHGEWMGMMKVSARGAKILRELLVDLANDGRQLRAMDFGALINEIICRGHEVRVVYTTGNWLDVDSIDDALDGANF